MRSQVLDKITLVQNAIYNRRLPKANFYVNLVNNGGSFLEASGRNYTETKKIHPKVSRNSTRKLNVHTTFFFSSQKMLRLETSSTVLLQDILLTIISRNEEKTVNIVLKVDIELMECKAFLGSPKLFEFPAKIPYILIEWNFNARFDFIISNLFRILRFLSGLFQ